MNNTYFKQFTDQELIDMAKEIHQESLPLKSKLRIAAHDIFNNESLEFIKYTALILLAEMTNRFEKYTNTIPA